MLFALGNIKQAIVAASLESPCAGWYTHSTSMETRWKGSVVMTAMCGNCWLFCLHIVLAVGRSDGKVSLVSVEEGRTLHTHTLEHSVTSLHWVTQDQSRYVYTPDQMLDIAIYLLALLSCLHCPVLLTVHITRIGLCPSYLLYLHWTTGTRLNIIPET